MFYKCIITKWYSKRTWDEFLWDDLDLSGSWCIKGSDESMTRVDSPVSLMNHDPDRSWITDPDPHHPKGTHLWSSIAARNAAVTCVLQVCVTILTASAFRGNHVLVLTKNHVTVLLGVQNTQQTAEVCWDAAWRSHVGSWFPVLGCCQAHDGVIAEASWREGRITLAHTVVGVKRDWSDDQIAEDVFDINMQIAPWTQNGRTGRWSCSCLVSVRLRISAKTTEKYRQRKLF